MTKSIAHFLEINRYIVYRTRQNTNNGLIVRVGRPSNGDKCPLCGTAKHHVHSNGRWRIKKHSNFQGKQLFIEVKRRRLKCRFCKNIFLQELPGIPKYARKTENFETQSLDYLSKNSFREVGVVNDVGYNSLKAQLYKHVNPYELCQKKIAILKAQDKIYLGIDGQSYRGQEMILTITEVFLKETITILPSEKKHDLEKFCRQIPEEIRAKVVAITMDMTNKHGSILKKYFPNALIVIDHYHVVQYAVMLMQKSRTNIQAALEVNIPIKKELNKNIEDLGDKEKLKLLKYFLLYPKLREAYLFKERVRSLYRLANHKKATQKFCILKQELLNSDNLYMQDLGRTLGNWQIEILNYFIYRITNAFTEGIHTKCKLIKRKSFGFRNVETYVRKLILGLFPLIFILS